MKKQTPVIDVDGYWSLECAGGHHGACFLATCLCPHHGEANTPVCTIDGCDTPVKARGLCSAHHSRAWRDGTLPPLPSLVERFWAKIDVSADGCWIWTGRVRGGYGGIRVERRMVQAHRFSYELLVGPIPPGLVIDHLCRQRRCVRPDHLEAITQAENIRRGTAPAIAKRRHLLARQAQAAVASLEPAVGAGSPTGSHARREHDVAGSSDGAAATHLDSGLEGKGPVGSGDRLLPSSADDELQACVDRHPSGRTNSQ